MNNKVGSTTNSEDKELGYYFCKAKDGVIDAETFVGKVIFYVWNDVFKDFADEAGDLFRDEDGTLLSFNKFYEVGDDGKTKVVEDKVALFMKNLGLEPILSDIISADDVVNTTSVIKVNGIEVKRVNAIPYTAIEEYVRLHGDMPVQDIINIWAPFKQYSMRSWVVATKEELDRMAPRYANYSYKIDCADGNSIWVNKDGWMHHPTNQSYRDTISEFINAVNGAGLGITITEESI